MYTDKDKEYQRRYREQHKEENLAYRKMYRETYKEQLRELSKKYREEHREELCRKSKEYYQQTKEEKRETRRESNRKYGERLKFEVLSFYSRKGKPVCVWCGEDRLPVLSLDHIFDNGEEERKIRMCGTGFYSYLRIQNYPDGYQTLCMNCQFLKAYQRRQERRGNASNN